MRAAALAALLLAGPARAGLFGGKAASTPVLWVPAETFSEWDAVRAALDRCEDLSFTLAAPAGLAGAAKRELGPLLSAGRVELALRLPGDPVLPLVAERSAALGAGRLAERVRDEAELFRAAASTAPAGFAPGAGALSPAVNAALAGLGFQWLAAGPYTRSTAPWAANGAVPAASAARPDGELEAGLLSGGAPVVVDEAQGLVRHGEFARLLRETGAGGRRCPKWSTFSAASGPAGKPARPASWPSWDDAGLGRWTASPASRSAWARYAEAAAALARWRDSGAVSVEAFDNALQALAAAESSAFFRGAEAEARERELRAALLAVYRRMKVPPPASLLSGAAAAPEDEPASGDLRRTRLGGEESGSLVFENPAASSARAPEFKLERFGVEWAQAGMTFSFRLARLGEVGLADVLLEAYLDLNGRPRAGSVQLLEPKAGDVAQGDAWEYALSVSKTGAYLLRSSPLSTPAVVGRLSPAVDFSAREVRVFVPSALLRGHPDRWGYAVAAFFLEPSTADRKPPRAQVRPDGSVMGSLGALDKQKAALSSRRPRLEAVRLR